MMAELIALRVSSSLPCHSSPPLFFFLFFLFFLFFFFSVSPFWSETGSSDPAAVGSAAVSELNEESCCVLSSTSLSWPSKLVRVMGDRAVSSKLALESCTGRVKRQHENKKKVAVKKHMHFSSRLLAIDHRAHTLVGYVFQGLGHLG